MAIMSVALAVAVDFGLPVAEGHHEIVKKESHPILSRQKRDWIWNALYVEEEKPAPVAYRIGKVERSFRPELLLVFLLYFRRSTLCQHLVSRMLQRILGIHLIFE